MIKKGTAFLLSIGAFLFGTVIGFLCAPVKKGIYIAGGDIKLAEANKDSALEETKRS